MCSPSSHLPSSIRPPRSVLHLPLSSPSPAITLPLPLLLFLLPISSSSSSSSSSCCPSCSFVPISLPRILPAPIRSASAPVLSSPPLLSSPPPLLSSRPPLRFSYPPLLSWLAILCEFIWRVALSFGSRSFDSLSVLSLSPPILGHSWAIVLPFPQYLFICLIQHVFEEMVLRPIPIKPLGITGANYCIPCTLCRNLFLQVGWLAIFKCKLSVMLCSANKVVPLPCLHHFWTTSNITVRAENIE